MRFSPIPIPGRVWRARQSITNLITNGGFEEDTTGWVALGSNTIEQSTEQAKFGSGSLKCTFQDNTDYARYAITFGAAGTFTASAWVYVPTAFDGTEPEFGFTGFVGSAATKTNLDLDIRDEWQRVVATNTVDAGDLTGVILLTEAGTSPSAGSVLYMDGVQVEEGSVATPYAGDA